MSGLAYRAGVLYDSFHDRNIIAVYDAQSGALKSTIVIGQLAATVTGLVAVSANKLVSLDDGNVKPLASTHLDAPRRSAWHRG
jgi:hypothetical protein